MDPKGFFVNQETVFQDIRIGIIFFIAREAFEAFAKEIL